MGGKVWFSIFHLFFVDISAVLRAVEFIFGALRSGSLAGQLGVKIIPPPFLVRPYFFTFEILQDFSTELDSPYAIYYSSVFSDLL